MANVNNHEEIDSPMPTKQSHAPILSQNMNQSPKISLQQNRYNPNSTPVSTNNSFNTSSGSQLSQSSLNWKVKPTPGQTVLSNSEIKEKVLQFRSPKNGSGKQMGLISKTSSQLVQ